MRPRLVGLLSTYREGDLALSALRTLSPHVDRVYVLDAPFGDKPPEHGEPTDWRRKPGNVLVQAHPGFESDEAKRTHHARWVCDREPGPVWGLILDGDEALINGDFVRDWVGRAEPDERALFLRIVEWDGTVMRTCHRLIRLDLLERYLLGAHQLRWKDSLLDYTFPNYLELGGFPPEDEERRLELIELIADGRKHLTPPWRNPLQGEPHFFHRPFLRPSGRFDERGSQAEADWAAAARATIGA